MVKPEDLNKEDGISRRDFIKKVGIGGIAIAGLSGMTFRIWAAEMGPDLVVAEKGTPAQLLHAALAPLGEMKKFVKPGQRVVLKPNIGWARTPEQAGNTNPDLVAAVIKACYDAGAREVVIWEHTCDNYQFTFTLSGIREAARKGGANIYSAHGENVYHQVDVPRGKKLKTVKLIKPVHQAEVLINIPIAKQHYATELTLSMKNLMGVVWDMEGFHRTDLHQYIADLNTVLRPNLIIMDAIRILTTNGPKGPGRVENLNMVIAGIDPVAIDAYAAGLFRKPKKAVSPKDELSKILPKEFAPQEVEFTDKPWRPEEVRYIKLAHEHGLGEINLAKVNIKKVSGI